MAKIQLVIDADTPEEYHSILRGLTSGASLSPEIARLIENEASYQADDKAREELQAKRKPGRPSKATAAEPAGEQTPPSSSTTGAEQPASGATTSPDPFAEQIKRSALTSADVKQAGAEYMKAHSVADSMALIKKIAGVEAFAQVPEDKYEELYAALKAG